MDLVGYTYKLWRNNEDRSIYSHLISLLLDRDCSAFVGAGLSVHAGYPSFSELINYLAAEANIDPADIQDLDNLSEKVTRIKNLIEGQRGNFFEILYRRFNNVHFPLKTTTPLLENFVNIPFKSIVTTNYDSCIERVAQLQKVNFPIQIYPHLIPDNLEAKKLYHIHGLIDLQDVEGSSASLVLTTENFVTAYGDNSRLPIFLSAILDSHNILFVGFALEEETLFNLLESSKRRNEFAMAFPGTPPRNPTYKIAILPIERSKINPKLPKDDIENYLAKISEEDDLMSSYDVEVIRYYADNNYSEIELIIKNIYEKTLVSTAKVNPDLTKLEFQDER